MFYNILTVTSNKVWRLALYVSVFSLTYAFVEYYVIQDTTLGMKPLLFSLLYPYHILMALVFATAAYGFMSMHATARGLLPTLFVSAAIFSCMLVIEDFTWFALRAAAPHYGDANAGKLIMQGEWSTQFLGSVNAYFTAIPNWYFVNIIFSCAVLMLIPGKQQLTVATVAAP